MDAPGLAIRCLGAILLLAPTSLALAQGRGVPELTAGADGFSCVEAQTQTLVVPNQPSGGLSTALAAIDGDFLVADGRGGLISIAVEEGAPRVRARLSFGDDFVTHLALDGRGQVWVTGEGFCVALVDRSQASELKLVGAWREAKPFGGDCALSPQAIAIDGKVLWLAWQHHLVAYDVSEPMLPRVLVDLDTGFQDTFALKVLKGALVATFIQPTSASGTGVFTRVTRVYDTRDLAHPLALAPDANGYVLGDGDRLYLNTTGETGTRLSRLTVALDDHQAKVEPLGTLPALTSVVGVVGQLVFAASIRRGLEVYSLTSLRLVGAVLGNFETGCSELVRQGDLLATATRFGGTQFVDLRALEHLPAPTQRFSGQTLRRNPAHGDLLTFIVQPGDSISTLLRRHGLVDPATTWRERMAPIENMNRGAIDDLDRLRPGQEVSLPLPRRLFCQLP